MHQLVVIAAIHIVHPQAHQLEAVLQRVDPAAAQT